MKQEKIYEIEKYIEEKIDNIFLVSNRELIKDVSSNFKFDENEDVNKIIRNKLYWMNKEGVIKRVERGLYKCNYKNKDITDKEEIILYLQSMYKNKWSLSSNSLEKEIGINIQISDFININLFTRYKDSIGILIKKAKANGIYISLKQNKCNSLLFSISELLYNKKYNEKEIKYIYNFTLKNKLDIFDLLIYDPIERMYSKVQNQWKQSEYENEKRVIFKTNFTLLMEKKWN